MTRTITTILFDLGQTLVRYYDRSEIPDVLHQAIASVQDYLRQQGLLKVSEQVVWQRVGEENHEAQDYHVRPLEQRLLRIFQPDVFQSEKFIMDMCRAFMEPIFARGYLYEDTIPTLRHLKENDFKTAIVSNTPWGSPARLWREEIARHRLGEYLDLVVFCRDVGWRKPARQIFEYALEKLHVVAHQCLFVGDDPRWDLEGPKHCGMDVLIIDREGIHGPSNYIIRNLHEVLSYLSRRAP